MKQRPASGPAEFANKTTQQPLRLGRRQWLQSSAGFALTAMGCSGAAPQEDPPPESPQPKLRLAVIDDAPLADAIDRQWKARAASALEISQLTVEEFRQRQSLSTDAVIYPSGMLGELVGKGMLEPLAEESLDSHALDQSDIFTLPRLRETNWGNGVIAVPLGSPVLSLVMRADLVDADPPTTWAEYANFAERAMGSKPAGSRNWRGAIEPLKGRWAAESLLARAATYARRRDTLATLFDLQTMQPLIAAPPFQRALEELREATAGVTAEQFLTPTETTTAVLEGRCGVAIGWLPPTFSPPDNSTNAVFAELPGSREAFDRRLEEWVERKSANAGRVTLVGSGGRMGSVTRLSANPKNAFQMLALIASADWSRRICPDSSSTAVFRQSHMATADAWAPQAGDLGRQYAAVVKDSLERSDWLFSPRIPGRDEYLNSLTQAVHKAILGEQASSAALQEAAEQWNAITQRLGKAAQQRAYEDSLVR